MKANDLKRYKHLCEPKTPAEEFINICFLRSILRLREELLKMKSTVILQSMGMLPADLGYHYVINIVNDSNERIKLIAGDFSGFKTTPTSWSDLWNKFSEIKSRPKQSIIDSECINQTIINACDFLLLPRTFIDIFAEGMGNRVRIIIKFTEGVGCNFWWSGGPRFHDRGVSTLYQIENYKTFFEEGCLREGIAVFKYSKFEHTEMLETLKRICLENPQLAHEVGIDHSLLTEEEWPESSMLDMTKFAIFLANIVMREVITTQGVYDFSNSDKTKSK